jgi:hypothetical protein
MIDALRSDVMTDYKDYLSGKIPFPDKFGGQLSIVIETVSNISSDKDDKVVNVWFDFKMTNIQERVKFYGTLEVMKHHMELCAGGDLKTYWETINKELKNNIIAEWKRMEES